MPAVPQSLAGEHPVREDHGPRDGTELERIPEEHWNHLRPPHWRLDESDRDDVRHQPKEAEPDNVARHPPELGPRHSVVEATQQNEQDDPDDHRDRDRHGIQAGLAHQHGHE